MVIDPVVILEWAAFSSSLICSWVYGYRTIGGPILGIITALLFMAFGIFSGIYAAAAANVIFLIVHIRNGLKLMSEDPSRVAARTKAEINDIVYRNSAMPLRSKHNAITRISNACHQASLKAGWWEDRDGLKATILLKVLLIHSEISEAMEGDRKSLMDDKLPHRTMFEVEFADAVIRIADLAGRLSDDFGEFYTRAEEFIVFGEPTGELDKDLCRIHYAISMVYSMCECTAGVPDDVRNPQICETIANLLRVVFDTARVHNLDLGGAIADKTAFNAVRPDHKLENRRAGNGKRY